MPADRRKARSRNGCLTCRIRKVKCDERRPVCKKCENSPNKCDWLEPGQSLSLRGQAAKGLPSPEAYGSPRRLTPSESPNTSATNEASSMASPVDLISLSRTDSGCHELPATHLHLANSLQLNAEDRAAFAYIPTSIIVLSYGKLWTWSCFSYIYTHIASQYPGVMRSFIAVANMELRASELSSIQDVPGSGASSEKACQLGASATAHYTQALKDLSSLLDHICQGPEQSRDIDALFVMWFLILRYEAYDSETTGASFLHLEGIRSFLRPFLQEDGEKSEKKLPCVAQAMLLYTLYLDADSATGNMNSGQFCLDFLSRDAHDYISHEHLFLSVRSALPKIWGEQYPVSELLDDLENYRPLRLYHLCQGAKLELLRLARSTTQDTSSLKRLCIQVERFGDEFADILLLAKKTPGSGGKRLMWTVYSAALDFHALQILCSSLDVYGETPFKPELSLSYIFAVATKALEEDSRQICRFMWSLSVALSKGHGHSSQSWLSSQLSRARVLMPKFGVPGLILHKSGGLQFSTES
ncbi:hypothetical protein FGRMN_140 [Fusarium graminum]|nr:hypothetical protein FGRMN_140 [Fusarium graminum]